MRRQSILVLAIVVIVVCVYDLPNAKGLIAFDDGGTHYVDYPIADNVDVRDSSSGKPTTVILLSGGSVNGEFTALDNSQITMSGGSVVDLESVNSSQIIMNGGHVVDDIEVHGESQLTISGGTVGDEIFVGWYSSYFDKSTLIISGGNFAIDGNSVDYGEYFASDYSRARITGTLANGDSLDNDFQIWDDSKLVLIPEPADLNDGLVAYFPFNGNANDESGNGYNGTVYGAKLTTDRFGNPDSAYSFDGIDDYIDIGSRFGGYSAFSEFAWIRADALKSGNNFIQSSNWYVNDPQGNDGGFDLAIRNGYIASWINQPNRTDGSMLLGPYVALDEWYFVGFTWDGSTHRLYLNGNEVASESYTGYIGTSAKTSLVAAKHYESGLTGFFDGKIDELRIYNRALTEAEVHFLYVISTPSAITVFSDDFENDTTGSFPSQWTNYGSNADVIVVDDVIAPGAIYDGNQSVRITFNGGQGAGVITTFEPVTHGIVTFFNRIDWASDDLQIMGLHNFSDTDTPGSHLITIAANPFNDVWEYSVGGISLGIPVVFGEYARFDFHFDTELDVATLYINNQITSVVNFPFENPSYGVTTLRSIDDSGPGTAQWYLDNVTVILETATLVLHNPNGGEILTSGRVCPIRWSSAGIISEVLIEYSVDNGLNWAAVSPPNVGNSGLYNWLVPRVNSKHCLVRISDVSDPNINDASEEVFTIQPASAGSIVTWGYNYQANSNVPAGNDFVSVTAGYNHGFALRSNGTLAMWGEGDCDVPAGNDFAAITPGLALRYDGSLAAFGCGDPYVPEGNDFVAISVYGFTVALRTDGSLLAWGNNEQGQVTKLPLDKDFVAIAADAYYGVAIRTDGSLTAWGSSSYDRLNVPAGNDFVDVTTGYGHGVALRSNGTIAVWGRDWYGNKSNAPTDSNFVEIAAGYDHSLALKPDGSIVAWGRNDNNQCDVPDGNNFFSIEAIGEQSLALVHKPQEAGYIVGWGYNAQGQCEAPVGNDFIEIAGGGYFSLALKSDGSLTGWGQNSSGQLGVPDGNDFIDVSAGIGHGLALKSDGSLAGWGRNVDGQNNVPTDTSFASISAGGHHNLAIKYDGSVAAWGQNNYGQCEVPEGNDFISISGGYLHSLGLKTNGSIAAWGNNDEGQCDVITGYDFAAVAGGGWHSVALKSDGSLEAWGLNDYGQCDVPEGNDFVAIDAGDRYSLALKSNGSLVAWGSNTDTLGNSFGQCNVPSGNQFFKISAGDFHGLALVSKPIIASYIDWTDLIAFCERWLDEGCSDVNDWCGRADINRSSVVDSVDYSWLAKYWGSIAPEPNAAGHPEPGDGASEVSITADLSWTAGGDTAAHGVYFGTNPTPDVNEFGGYQTGTIFKPGTMAADTTYYWQVDEVGLGGEKAGDVWSFTTSPVPGKAYNPSPIDSATNININHNLGWTANFYTTSQDVYFGTNPTPGAGEFKGNQTSTTFEPGTLDYETTYYWRIDSVGPGGTTTGIIWSFTTEAPPVPEKAGNPIPADMATDVGITTCLSWAAGANTESHEVYFGTNPIPDVNDFQGNQATTTFCPPESLEYNTTYYWRIDEKNPYNTTTGDVWSFTTMQDPNLAGWWKFEETSGVIAYDSSGNGNHGQLVDGLGNGLVWSPGEGALNFDGSNNLSRVVVSTVGMSTTEGAIGFWVKLAEPQNRGDGRNGSGYFFGCDNGVKDRILLYMDNSNTELDVRIGDHSETNIITLGTLVWYHIALTWDSGSYMVYLNGSVMSAGTYDGLTSLPSTADIGNNGGSSKQSFHGLMGDLQVYDKSISGSDIQELY